MKNKNRVSEYIVLFSAVIMLVISTLCDIGIIDLPNFILSKIDCKEDLAISLFETQASVATIGIAVVSIINGMTNDSIYGVSITDFITTIKPHLFKFKYLIVIDLLLTAVNFFCMSYLLINVSIAILMISLTISIIMMLNTFVVFRGKEYIRKEISDYLTNHITKTNIDELGKELSLAIDIGDTATTKNDLEIIGKIFESSIKNDDLKKEIPNQLLIILGDTLEATNKLANSRKSNDFLQFIVNIYKIANNHCFGIDFFNNNYRAIFKAFSCIAYEQMIDEYIYRYLYRCLIKNAMFCPDNSDGAIPMYASWLLKLSIDYNNISPEKRQDFQDSIYDMVYFSMFYYPETDEDNGKKIKVKVLLNYHKALFDNGIKLGENFIRINPVNNKEEYNIIYIITVLYAYYIAYKEPLITNDDIIKNAADFIKENKSKILSFFLRIGRHAYLMENYSYILNVLKSWEYLKLGEAKLLIMEYIIEDFFIFLTIKLFYKKENIENIVKTISPESVFPIYSRFFEDPKMEYLLKEYKIFEKAFFEVESDESIKNDFLLLRDVCDSIYHDEIIQSSDKHIVATEKVEVFGNRLVQEVNDFISKTFSCFSFDNNGINEEKKLPICSFIINDYCADESEVGYYKEEIENQIINIIFNIIKDKLELKEVLFSNKYKQKTLIDNAEELEIHPNIVLGSRTEFYDEENPQMLQIYTKDMIRIEFRYGYNYYILLDSSLFDFSIDNIKSEIVDLSWNEISDNCKTEDGVLKYNVANSIYVPFGEDELKKYISKTKKKIVFSADFKYTFKSNIVGTGIHIITEDKSKESSSVPSAIDKNQELPDPAETNQHVEKSSQSSLQDTFISKRKSFSQHILDKTCSAKKMLSKFLH